jgi:hypothetical protein
MTRLLRLALASCVLASACAPAAPAPGSPGPALAASDTATWPVRPVRVSDGYHRALERGTRSGTGAPGGRYWQQRVRYDIRATVDPAKPEVIGSERIAYHNRSPDSLSYLVLNLYQNVFAPGARRNRTVTETGGIRLDEVSVALGGGPARRVAADSLRVSGTTARVLLPRPLAPGDSLVLAASWRFTVPPAGTFRTAWQDALEGRALQVAQWYPQIATYDDVRGWDETPYLGDGEFFLEYGDFDVALTVPANHLVGATGELRNPAEVLRPETLDRLAAALGSDSALPVVTAEEVAAGQATVPGNRGQVTWRFRATDVRDFAFALSDRYVWDAGRATIPAEGGGTRDVAVHALYRPGASGWERAARYGQHAVGFFSRQIVPYLYPQVTVTEGSVGGMEYPQLVFIGKPATAEALESVIAHEVGHEWFPMMVGSDEAAFAWMDEGITTYHEDMATADFFPGSTGAEETATSYLRVAGKDNEVPLMRHTDLVSPYGARTVAAYTKPAAVLRALRSVVGRATLDRAMRTYAREWQLKHPYPWDFFDTVEREAGRDLDWFWHPWFFETATLDQAVTAVENVDGGVRVTVRSSGGVAMPARVRVTTEGGASTEGEVEVERWIADRRRTVTLLVPTYGGAVTRVEVDPEHAYPDVDRANNVWTPAGR